MSPRFIIVPQHFGSTVFDRSDATYSAFDQGATALLRAATAAPISELLQGISDPEERAATTAFVDYYRGRGFFTGERLDGKQLAAAPPENHLLGPLTVHLSITSSCQLCCKHCFANESTSSKALALNELDRLFEEMASLGSFRLGLTGGEPLLHPDLLQILDLALGHGLVPCLTTNGLAITRDLAQALGKRRFGWLNVSLDGATAEINDEIRGTGTFHQVMERVKVLREFSSFSLAMTLTSRNSHQVEEMCSLGKQIGAQAVVLRPLYPVGGAQSCPELMPTFGEYLSALSGLEARSEELGLCMASTHAFGPGTRLDTHSIVYEGFGCGAANTVCSIDTDGDISPCSFLGPEYVAGNLRDTSLAAVWSNSVVFREMRELEGNAVCEGCQRYDICSGGCRARALYGHGTINSPDPFCMECAPDRKTRALAPETTL